MKLRIREISSGRFVGEQLALVKDGLPAHWSSISKCYDSPEEAEDAVNTWVSAYHARIEHRQRVKKGEDIIQEWEV